MSEPRRIVVGVLPSGGSLTLVNGEADPVVRMIAEAGAELDRQRAEDERAEAARLSDIERAKNTRRARVGRRLKKAMMAMRVFR